MNIALLGTGRMGRAVEEAALARGHHITLRVDGSASRSGGGVARDALEAVDVAIDFSVGGAVARHVEACAAAGVDVVVGTTGWEPDRERVERAVLEAGIGLVHAPNFSIGVHVFARIVAEAARTLDGLEGAGGHDVALHETHHRHKRDHPSGTARRLADLLVEALRAKTAWSAALPPSGAPAEPDLLQVSVSRVGETPGTHAVVIDGPDDRIELVHEARGRGGFARGAVTAAEWIRGRPGVFTMDDVLSSTRTDP